MRQVHRAGDKLFIDYAGPTIALTGGGKANIFVAAMGASGYAFAWATPAQTTADWLEGCCRALAFYGGVPQLIVPDNPRAVIAQASRYEPRATDTVLDFACHYGCSVLPARAYHPQDKAKVESTVQIVERWILARLRHQSFHSVAEVNAAMAPLLEHLNNKPFQKLPRSRASVFATIDAPALMVLPLEPFELAVFKTVKVHIDYHVEFEGHRYSVPHALVGQTLEVRVTRSTLEILNRGPGWRSTPIAYAACLAMTSSPTAWVQAAAAISTAPRWRRFSSSVLSRASAIGCSMWKNFSRNRCWLPTRCELAWAKDLNGHRCAYDSHNRFKPAN